MSQCVDNRITYIHIRLNALLAKVWISFSRESHDGCLECEVVSTLCYTLLFNLFKGSYGY
jgi:hypothetical protein